MFSGLIELIKEFKEWTPKAQTLFLIGLVVSGLGYATVNLYTDQRNELNTIKDNHNKEIAKIHNEYNTLILKMRSEFQSELNEYVYKSAKENSDKVNALYEELENTKKELIRLRSEIKKVKNEVVQ